MTSVDVGLKLWSFAPIRLGDGDPSYLFSNWKACRSGIKLEESWLGSKFSYKPLNVSMGLLIHTRTASS